MTRPAQSAIFQSSAARKSAAVLAIALAVCPVAVAAGAFAGNLGDAALRYLAGERVLREPSGAVAYQWPGTYFEAEFTGDGVEARLDDSSNRWALHRRPPCRDTG